MSEHVIGAIPVAPRTQPFRSPAWLPGGHLQTIWPYLLPRPEIAFRMSVVLKVIVQFTVGVLRTLITKRPGWRSGLEMLFVGALAGGAAFVTGRLIDRWSH